ncbi:MAG: hypothetical protein IKH65_03890 [Clostridia bacterium]|nr:hypothetical protein [Clostridia bacterium]
MKSVIKSVSLILAVTALIMTTPVSAFADWYDEVSGGTYVEIEGSNFVADTFCGVDALYNENNAYYQCNELIMRFYSEAYGLSVMAYENTGLIMSSSGYRFVQAQTPKPGDIIYSPSRFRKNRSDHWAIVKSYSGGKITMFEQNVVWEGKAAKNRTVKFPSDYYYLYTPVAKFGFPDPVLRGAPETATESTVVTTTKVTTTTAATTKITTTTSATTKATATTATTAKVTTAAETVSTAAITSTTVTATESATVTETESTVPETESAVPVTETQATVTLTDAGTEAPTETLSEATEKNTANSFSSGRTPAVIAVAALLAAVAVLSALIIRKRKK